MAVLGGSPLGLIGLRSTPVLGRSSFNAGNSRNVDVNSYNQSKEKSLFSGKRIIRAWPNIQKKVTEGTSGDAGEEFYDVTGTSDVDYINKKDNWQRQSNFHADSVYDTSILNIIEKLSGTLAQLRPADFAYLKNVGVYPNNRLMIARRFATPIHDNIMQPFISRKLKDGDNSDVPSLATLISWVPENTDFLDITFGEEWTDADADFKTILNSIGEDLKIGNLGGISGAAGNALPLPGFTEIFQRRFLAAVGIMRPAAADDIPAGNPNLVKQAKRRKTIGYSEAGSGLSCQISIKMTCEYEQKFISGIDPTIVWMDLLGMITRFGTSSSETYGLSPSFAAKIQRWMRNPSSLITDLVSSLKAAITGLVEEVRQQIEKIYNSVIEAIKPDETPDPNTPEPSASDKEKQKALEEKQEQSKILNLIGGIVKDISNALVAKYRVRITGVLNALTGSPSTPWHITIGNPMRPVFCSGDMLTTAVNLKLGPNLGFNDLPSSITVEFTLTNARPWGMQEIMAKFNSGYLRTIDAQRTLMEASVSASGVIGPIGQLDLEPSILPSSSGTSGTSGSSGTSGNSTTTNNTNPPQGNNPPVNSSGTSGSAGTSGTGNGGTRQGNDNNGNEK